ncbi:MAG TPA: ABC transporter permease [Gemmatimonadaceae bacterium]|nr:ABC transporter permease [Gemmatimonadaceae bacterium]
MRSAFWPMLWKEFIQMRRDRFTLAMMIGIPAIQLMLFGYAIRMEVRHVPMVVMDESRTAESRALVDVLRNTGNFDVAGAVRSRDELRQSIESGKAHAALVIPPDYLAQLKRGRGAQAQLIVDAADPLSATAAINGAALAATATSLSLTDMSGGRVHPLEVRVRPWYNPDLKSSTFIVPGIIGVLLAMMLILITSMAIVRERERGTLEQLVVTPIGKTSLMLGKIVPFIVVGYVQMTVVLVLGKLLFDIPVRGSLVLLYVLTMAYIVANLALGLLVSTVTKTQVQAMQLSFFLIMPNILLSGFMFPRDAMPAPAQWLGAALPLTYYLSILRGVLLKGIGMSQLWPETAALCGFAVGLIFLSVIRFTKTVG